jgi:starch phosphorylase
MEACGTSGMKASLNGALQLSTSDGWVDEIDVKKIGWELSEDATAQTLYDILEREVAPLFYGDKAAWAAKMRNNIALIEQDFSAERMLKDYFSKLYFPTE